MANTQERHAIPAYTLRPGDFAIFRNAGTGPPRVVRVLPRGPLGQFMVWFEERGFSHAVNEGTELFRE